VPRFLAIVIPLALAVLAWFTAPIWRKGETRPRAAAAATPAEVVTEATTDALCRPPTDAEVAKWNARTPEKNEVLAKIFGTNEGQMVSRIREIHLKVLARDPFDGDCAAVRRWVEEWPGVEELERRLATSPEGRRVEEVRQAFIETLRRDPRGWDNASVRRWVDSGIAPAEIKARIARQRPLVGAYYFTWYRFADNQWGNGATAVPAGAPEPTLGWYSSADATVIDTHIKEMTASGFDFAIVNVTADVPDSWKSAHRFFDRLSGHPLKAAVMIDGLYGGAAAKADWVRKVQAEFARHPNYVSYHEAPLIMLFASRLDFSVPGTVLRNVYWTHSYAPGSNTFNLQYALYPRDWPFWSPSPQEVVNGVVPVIPGYVDTHLGRAEQMEYPRKDGQLYKEQWQRALALRPEVIIVYSWNEHFEQTAIEPTKTWGDRYLRATACYIAQAHAGTTKPCD